MKEYTEDKLIEQPERLPEEEVYGAGRPLTG
jgi:hypothetical protein